MGGLEKPEEVNGTGGHEPDVGWVLVEAGGPF